VLEKGTRKPNRTGVDTISTFNHNYEIDLSNGFPLLTTKDISWKNIVVEMLWFLSGQTDISILKRHGCKFWDAWADENGKVPSAYGNFWRQFPVHTLVPGEYGGPAEKDLGFNDQIAWVLAEMKRNPMSRRMVISAWAPGNAQESKLPPCHCLFMFNVQNINNEQRLCLHLTQRSCDIALGVPYNIASYSLLLHIFSHLTGIKPGIFAHTLVDAHIYTCKEDGTMSDFDHIPGLKEQLSREPRNLPQLVIDPSITSLQSIEALMKPEVSTEQILDIFKLENYNPYPAIKFKVAV
jgi:thymidylate synthase